MKHGFLRTAAAVVAAVFLCAPSARAAEFQGSVSAKSAILIDAGSGRVLFEKNADERSLIASTTKIMTGLLVCEAGDLEREVSVPAEAGKRRGGGAGDCNLRKCRRVCFAHERKGAGARYDGHAL